MTQSTADRVLQNDLGRAITKKGRQSQTTFWTVIETVLEPIASLKLTVGLLSLAVFIVWVCSLQQTRSDIWTVKAEHFGSLLVFVPFKVFFPPAWFPNLQNLPGGCFLPSGFTVLILMIVNLLAAHIVRMRVQASGLRLLTGLLVSVMGIGITWLIVFGAQNPDGFQTDYSPTFFKQLWYVIQIAILGVGVACAIGSIRMDAKRNLERIFLGSVAAAMVLVFGLLVYLGDHALLGDSALRILWQLIQGTIAAAVMIIGFVLIFKRKGAIVLIHLGILMIMGNEVYVSLTNVEQQMAIIEGDSASHAEDSRYSEMVVADVSDTNAVKITTIPSDQLRSGKQLEDDQLPFSIQCVEFFENSEIEKLSSVTKDNLADAGLGRFFEASQVPRIPAVGSDRANDRPAAYVRLTDKSNGKVLGKYLISQFNYAGELLDTISLNGKEYRIGLRYRTYLKPYVIKLQNAESQNYDGTTIAKSYSSDFLLTDVERGVFDNPQRVWMNNPLRYGNETFYQTSYGRLMDGREYSVLQIVKNSGWMIPYVACMFVVLGLIVQFGNTLGNVIVKRESEAAIETTRLSRIVTTTIGIGVVVLVIYLTSSELYRGLSPKVELAGMRIDKLARIPILYEGRVQPLDSLARNIARQLSSRESVAQFESSKSQPAIRWFSDTVFRAPGWEKYKIFRITDLNVINDLGLKAESPFKYSFADLDGDSPIVAGGRPETRLETLERLVKDAKDLPEEKLSNTQKRLIDLQQKITLVKNLQVAFGDPKFIEQKDGLMARLIVGGQMALSNELPRAILAGESTESWITIATFDNREWLSDLARQHGSRSSQELAKILVEENFLQALRKQMQQEETIRLMQMDPEIFKILEEHFSKNSDERNLTAALDKIPRDKLQAITDQANASVEKDMAAIIPDYISRTAQLIDAIGLELPSSKPSSDAFKIPASIEELFIAKKSTEFNERLDSYLASDVVKQKIAHPNKTSIEMFYNWFSPFFVSMLIYIVAFLVAVVGVVTYPRQISRIVMWTLLAGLLIHASGICLRIVISGRPPVTSLYSSVIFISACCVGLLLLVERLTRLNIGNVLASAAGFGMLLWAWTMSIKDGDTFTVLVAVLDTQFWLSTHVICISLGYVTTITAGLVGAAYLISSLFIARTEKNSMLMTLGNIVYGLVCFGLLFSFFGTVLGGLWADDSWGRFWGWDTKENGALMIVLWNAVLLHARWAGLVRAKGIAAISVLGIALTFWSWQGVNLLGVGLHNYGFSSEGLWVLTGVVTASCLVAAIALLPNRTDLPNTVAK